MSAVGFSWSEGIGTITLDDPATRNALNDEIVVAIKTQLSEWALEPGLRGLVLTGAGGAFSSGGKLDMIEQRREQARSPEGRLEIAEQMRSNSELIEVLTTFPAPTVAAIDGACVGAAIGWACACDLRLASDRARFITGFIKVGLSTDFGTSRMLERTVGRGRAAHWLLTSPAIGADDALAAGLVSAVHTPEGLLPAAVELLSGLTTAAALATRSNLDDGGFALTDALDREAQRFAELLGE